jgi:Flp pilus assembly protein protease CpaA
MGVGSAGWLTHSALIGLFLTAPFVAWNDFTRHRIPERISIPWLVFSSTVAIITWPHSALGILIAAGLMAVLGAVALAGILRGEHYLGIADVIVTGAIALALADDRTFPPFAPIIVLVAASVIALGAIAFRRSTQGGPLGGSLALAAIGVGATGWIIAR